ncbi:MAG: MATE family efflux transporter [Chitinophagaceae bacterium]|nr:MATE family efflux transporter [Chitinophagaceae bacterium]
MTSIETENKQNIYPLIYHIKENIRLGFPIIVTELGTVIILISASIMIGQFGGSDDLASLSLGNNIFSLAFAFAVGASYAITIFTSHLFTQKNRRYSQTNTEKLKDLLKHGLIFNLVIGVILLGFLLCIVGLLDFMRHEESVLINAKNYLKLISFSIIPLLIFRTFSQFVDGIGKTNLSMIVVIIGSILNIISNYLFIFGNFGFPQMGINAPALSFIITQVFMAMVMGLLLFKLPSLKIYTERMALGDLFKDYSLTIFINLFKVGVPSGLNFIFEIMMFSVAAVMIGYIGYDQLAAHQIAYSVVHFNYVLGLGIANVTIIKVGHYLGKEEYYNIRKSIAASRIITLSFASIVSMFSFFFNHQIIHIFSTKETVDKIALNLLLIGIFQQLVDALQITSLGSLRGFKNTRYPLVIICIGYFAISFPVCYFLSFYLDYGVEGIWIGLFLGMAFCGVCFIFKVESLCNYYIKKNIKHQMYLNLLRINKKN